MNHPVYLALDIGEKRIGLAVGSLTLPPQGRGVVTVESDDWQAKLKSIIQDDTVQGLVLGIPEVVSGQTTSSQKQVTLWRDRLAQEFNLPLSMVNEAYTSVEAERQLRTEGVDTAVNKAAIDERSAQLILEQFLHAQ